MSTGRSTMNLPLLRQSIQQAQVIKKGDYEYIIHPLIDGIPAIKMDLILEVIQAMKQRVQEFEPFDSIVTIEAMGIPLATLLAKELGKPLTIIRKRIYDLDDETRITQRTGYSTSTLTINGLQEGDRIMLVDDVISTGDTLRSVLQGLVSIKVQVQGVCLVFDKGENVSSLIEEFNIPIDFLLGLNVKNGQITIREESIST